MKCNIYGLTGQNIMINSIGINIKGNSSDLENYPYSIAKNIELSSDGQVADLEGLERAGLIKVEYLDKPKKKGDASPKKPKGVKSVKRIAKKQKSSDELEDDSESVVVSPTGKPVKAKTLKPGDNIQEDPELVRASLEEAERLEKEEAEEKLMDEFVDLKDESDLDPSERMGEEATVYTGNKKIEKVKMQRHVVGEPESEWLDPEFSDDVPDEADDAFIDRDDGDDDRFIE